jgi:hypothetical protein
MNLMMEAVRTCETSVYYNETTRRNIPEGSNLISKESLRPKPKQGLLAYYSVVNIVVRILPLVFCRGVHWPRISYS